MLNKIACILILQTIMGSGFLFAQDVNAPSKSNKKQQVSKVDSTGNGGSPQPAKANINTSRSNIKQQGLKADTTGNGGSPQPAKSNTNTSRSNKKQ